MNPRIKNLLFIEGNRQNLDKENLKNAYAKIKAHGYISTMPIEYITMAEAKELLKGKKLYTVEIIRKNGEGQPSISNFEIKTTPVKEEEYANYDGVCIDGQHRTLALLFPDMEEYNPSYSVVEIPDGMDILSYVALRNNGKTWKNSDFLQSGVSTGNAEIDHILDICKNNKEQDSFFLSIFTLDTITLRANQVKKMQLGYKTAEKFRKLQLSPNCIEMGERILQAIRENKVLTSDRCNGRFGAGLKNFYIENGKNFDSVLQVIEVLDNEKLERYMIPEKGRSLEIIGYAEAFKAIWEEYNMKQADIA